MLAELLVAQPRPAGPPPPPAPVPQGQAQGQYTPRRAGGGGQQQARKEYRADELCTVEGYVRNGATGEALSKASITLFSTGGRQQQQQSYAASTDASGKFSVRSIEPGQYRISVRRNGYVSSEQSGRRALTPGSTLTLSTSQTIKGVEARLIPHGVVTGRVLDFDGEPMVSANVQLMRYRYTQQGQRELTPVNAAQTNDLGEYRVFGLPPGRYYIGVMVLGRMGPGFQQGPGDPAGADGPVPTFYPSASDPSQANPIDVQMGFTVQGTDVRLLRARSFPVSGQVVGAPAGRRQGMVMLLPRTDGSLSAASPLLRGSIGAPWLPDGKFTVRAVPPGSYTIMAESFEGENRMRGSADVDVGDRGVDNAQVVMQPGFDLPGAVRLAGQGTLDSSSISVNLQPRQRGRNMGGGGSRGGEDGKLLVRQMFNGHYDVVVSGLPENHYVKSVRAGEMEVLTDGLHALPGMQLDVLISAGGGKVSGTVVNDKGDVVSSATVVLMAPKAPLMHRLKTASVDQRGQFQMSGIAPGDYLLAAIEEVEAGEYWEPEFLTKNEKLIEKLSIRENATANKALKVIGAGGQ